MSKLLNKIKSEAKNSGTSMGKFVYCKDGQKRRLRFLTDFEDAIEIPWLGCYAKNINCPNPEFFGKTNPYKDDEDVKEDTMYLWQVYDYDANAVKFFMYKANNCSPVYSLATKYEIFNTLLDRDYVLTCTGEAADRSMEVVNKDKSVFTQGKAGKVKKVSLKVIKDELQKAYSKFQGDIDDDNDDTPDYTEMDRKSLYKLAKKRGLDPDQGEPKAYYVNMLEDYDEEEAAKTSYMDEPEDEDDVWDDEDTDKYEGMSEKELYRECKKISDEKVKTRQSREYYIAILESQSDDSWDDDDDDWDDDDEEEDYNGLPFK